MWLAWFTCAFEHQHLLLSACRCTCKRPLSAPSLMPASGLVVLHVRHTFFWCATCDPLLVATSRDVIAGGCSAAEREGRGTLASLPYTHSQRDGHVSTLGRHRRKAKPDLLVTCSLSESCTCPSYTLAKAVPIPLLTLCCPPNGQMSRNKCSAHCDLGLKCALTCNTHRSCFISSYGTCFRLLRLCGGAPKAGLLDLAASAIQPVDALQAYNPFLSPKSCIRLVAGARVWMQLCVLEDRLRRIRALSMASEESKPLLIQVSLSRKGAQMICVQHAAA